MTRPSMVVVLRAIADALAGAADELEADAETRAAERDVARTAQTEADILAVVAVVARTPGIAAGELRAAMVAAGMSGVRARTAIDAAVHAGRVTISEGPGTSRRHHVAGGAA